MNNPSSTSNFDDSAEQVPMGLQLFVPTRTAIVATACVAIVLLGLQLAYAKILLADNKDPITQRIKVLNRGQEAKILFFGSSRFHSCIKPRTIETTLGLKEGDVVNFAGAFHLLLSEFPPTNGVFSPVGSLHQMLQSIGFGQLHRRLTLPSVCSRLVEFLIQLELDFRRLQTLTFIMNCISE